MAGTRAGMQWQQNQSATIIHTISPPSHLHNLILSNPSLAVQIFGNNINQLKSIQEEIKSRLRPGNACYHSVQNLSSSQLSKNIKMQIYSTNNFACCSVLV
jgi:ABC-type iron transport system FetAB permease component